MNDDLILRILKFFEGMTKEERKNLYPCFVVATEILSELLEEDEDERTADL